MINAMSAADIALSCQVQRLPGYQAPWSVLLRNRMQAERFASVSEDELFSINVYKIFKWQISVNNA